MQGGEWMIALRIILVVPQILLMMQKLFQRWHWDHFFFRFNLDLKYIY